jgi:hypothetical protein
MTLSPIVNTDIKMPAKMLNALSLHETRCVVDGHEAMVNEKIKIKKYF